MHRATLTHKEAALRAVSRGDLQIGLELLRTHCRLTADDLWSRLKLAELLERLGLRQDAVQEYRAVARAYSRSGFFMKAISLYNTMLRMDRFDQEASTQLQKLGQQKTDESASLQPFLRRWA